MTNNDVLRRIRYIFDLSDDKMIKLFGLAGFDANRTQICDWLKQEDAESFLALSDQELATYLNGLIVDKRGKKDGPQPAPEQVINNNIILRKLKIALNLQSEDVLSVLESVGFSISKHELSALFRKEGHKHFRKCNDQLLRNFLTGLEQKFRNV